MTFPPTNKLLVVICGPTASGKTDYGVQLAKHFKSEVISADSRQFYREMQIGTARPLPGEIAEVPHHFMGFLNVEKDFSAGRFASEAKIKIDELFEQHKVVFAVGGSGLYINALVYGMDDIPAIDKNIRAEVNNEWKKFGLEYLQEKAQIADPALFKTIDIQNPKRLIRIIEIYRQTGNPLSFYYSQTQNKAIYPTLFIGMEWEREALYNRINKRVDEMMRKGLLKEAGVLFPKRDLNALQTVGYRELFDFFEENISLERAVELIKQNTRRYAKRQLTWFRKNKQLIWVNPNHIQKAIGIIEKIIN